MNPRTLATLDQLEHANWFSNVGVRDTTTAMLGSWQEAIECCGSLQSENLRIEASDRYRERLIERSKERFHLWNQIVNEVKVSSIPLVTRKIEGVERASGWPKVVKDIVQWDVLGACMEAEYADVYPPGFYASLSYWYVKGHFPCGWRGKFPAGSLIIY